MFKKYKQLIVGFIIGSLLFTIIPVSANIGDYLLQKSQAKLIVDGKEFSNKELPVLNYKGYNYIPAATFRDITDTLGIGFEWIEETKQIEIDTNKKIISKEGSTNNMTNTIKEEYNIITEDGIEYIALREIGKKHPGYDFQYEVNSGILKLVYNSDQFRNRNKEVLLLEDANLEIKIQRGSTYMKYDDFENIILPIINNRG